MAQSAGKYVRAPSMEEEEISSAELLNQLAVERSMRASLASELEQSRKEIEELRASRSGRDTSSCPDNHNMDFELRAGCSSTRHMGFSANTNHSFEESRFLCSMNQLSVASINLPECRATDGEQIHRQTFEQWKDLLVDSLKLAGIEDETTMYTVFKVKAGPRLLEIFRNTSSDVGAPNPDSEPFSNALHRLKSYFGSGSDIMLLRRRLALMVQKHDESDLNFIARVGSTARLCQFEEDKEFEEVVATVAEHARSREVRTTALKMLSRKGSFTELVDKVRELEAIQLNEEYVMQKHGKRSDQPALIAPVRSWESNRSTRGNKTNRGYPSRRGGWYTPRGRQASSGVQNQPQGRERCWRCFSVYHSANICTAKDKVCNRCGSIGHIRRACVFGGPKRTAQEMETTPAKIAAVEKVEEVKVDEGMETNHNQELVWTSPHLQHATRFDVVQSDQVSVSSDLPETGESLLAGSSEFNIVKSETTCNEFNAKSIRFVSIGNFGVT
ncbi:uncharacterized protein LOC134212426 [Armigeres subalbatus]|uniref:uncharacterized protein LOC134212426 n=1 Tax=Armigeres subalbatus TaxID=124917 RepID=UPI002ED5360B